MKYRLLKPGEMIKKNDEALQDDAETWVKVNNVFTKCMFNYRVFMPIRRSVKTN